MKSMLLWIGRVAGLLGLFLCVAGVSLRIGGKFFVGEFPVGTLFIGGVAAMVLGCLALLYWLVERQRQ